MLTVSMKQPDGEPIVFLGLTGEDLRQLQDSQTLMINMEELGLPTGRAYLLSRPDLATLHGAMKAAGLNVPDLPARLPARRECPECCAELGRGEKHANDCDRAV